MHNGVPTDESLFLADSDKTTLLNHVQPGLDVLTLLTSVQE